MNRLIVIIMFPFIVLAISSCVNRNVVFKPDKQEVKKDKRILQGSDQVNKRIKVVAQDGSGDYRAIQAALDRSQPGDIIQVKNGVYVERVNFETSGTRDLPITLVNYREHSPVIEPGGGSYPESSSKRVEIDAEWIILEGFEIRYGWDGVKIYKGHNTIRNNWIHNNRYQGILVVSVGDILIDGNQINNNGTDPGACYSDSWGGVKVLNTAMVYI